MGFSNSHKHHAVFVSYPQLTTQGSALSNGKQPSWFKQTLQIAYTPDFTSLSPRLTTLFPLRYRHLNRGFFTCQHAPPFLDTNLGTFQQCSLAGREQRRFHLEVFSFHSGTSWAAGQPGPLPLQRPQKLSSPSPDCYRPSPSPLNTHYQSLSLHTIQKCEVVPPDSGLCALSFP